MERGDSRCVCFFLSLHVIGGNAQDLRTNQLKDVGNVHNHIRLALTMWALFLMLLSSGQKIRPKLVQQVYHFMVEREPLLKDVPVIVHHRRLTAEGVTGWQFKDAGEFMIEIHRDLPRKDYIKTLIHELVHVRQDLTNMNNEWWRETEAYALEFIYYHEFTHA